MKIAFLRPIKPQVSGPLQEAHEVLVNRLMTNLGEHEVSQIIDREPVEKLFSDYTPWSKVMRVRNRMIEKGGWQESDYIFWLDADVIEAPDDLIPRLVTKCEGGIIAPMVLIEETRDFYDWCAFVIDGMGQCHPHIRAAIPGRNLTPNSPYWPASADVSGLMPMDCVGSCYLIPTSVYKSGVKHEDHPSFTDHFSVCQQAKRMGLKVQVDTTLEIFHANLPKWGEQWH